MSYSHCKSIYLSLPIFAVLSLPTLTMANGVAMTGGMTASCETNSEAGNCQQLPERLTTCAANPEAQECQRPPKGQMGAYCAENPEDEKCQQLQERLAACAENPDAQECQRPPQGQTIEAYCAENPETEKCQRHQERLAACAENPDAQECQGPPQGQPIEAYCAENPEDEKCQQRQEKLATCAGDQESQRATQHGPKPHVFKQVNRCKRNPEECQNPGPGVLELQKGQLHLPVIQVPLADGEVAHYEANLQMTEDGAGFTIEEVTYLEGESDEEEEIPQ